MRLSDATDRFLLQLRADGRSPHTLGQYRRHLALFGRWMHDEQRPDDLCALGHEDIAAFLVSPAATHRADGQLRHPSTTNALRSSLRGFFRYLHGAGHLERDPARLTRRAMVGPPAPNPLSDDEQAALLGALDAAKTPAEQRDRVLFTLLLRAGLRIGAALSLEVGDVDLARAELHLRRGKGGREDRLPVSSTVSELLRSWIGSREQGPVFPGRDGGALTRRHVARRLEHWLGRAEIRRSLSPHSLRHSFATNIYRRTGDIRLVQSAMTHRSIASTLVYARIDEDRLRAALEG